MKDIKNVLRPIIFNKVNEEKTNKDLFQDAIKDVSSQIACIDTWFQIEDDNDLVEACIYQKKSLKARYRYLLKKIKETEVSLPPFDKSV